MFVLYVFSVLFWNTNTKYGRLVIQICNVDLTLWMLLFCWFEGDRKDSFRGTVQWYWWTIELPRSLQNKATSRYEVFLNRKNYENQIDLETILKLHEVSQLVLLTLLHWCTDAWFQFTTPKDSILMDAIPVTNSLPNAENNKNNWKYANSNPSPDSKLHLPEPNFFRNGVHQNSFLRSSVLLLKDTLYSWFELRLCCCYAQINWSPVRRLVWFLAFSQQLTSSVSDMRCTGVVLHYSCIIDINFIVECLLTLISLFVLKLTYSEIRSLRNTDEAEKRLQKQCVECKF